MSLFGKQKDDADERPAATATAPPARVSERSKSEAGPNGPIQGKGGKIMANIGKSITIKGDLTGNEDLVIEGTVEGRIELPDNQLTIGANGDVRAELNAKTVIVIGKVTGNVRGTERIEIQATGSVEGDVSAPRLVVAEGAVLNGSIEMGAAAGKSQMKATPAPAPESERKAG